MKYFYSLILGIFLVSTSYGFEQKKTSRMPAAIACINAISSLIKYFGSQLEKISEFPYKIVVVDGKKYIRLYRSMPHEEYLKIKNGTPSNEWVWTRSSPYEYAQPDWVTVEFLVPKNKDEIWYSSPQLEADSRFFIKYPTIRPRFDNVLGMSPGDYVQKRGIKSEKFERLGVKTLLPQLFPERKFE